MDVFLSAKIGTSAQGKLTLDCVLSARRRRGSTNEPRGQDLRSSRSSSGFGDRWRLPQTDCQVDHAGEHRQPDPCHKLVTFDTSTMCHGGSYLTGEDVVQQVGGFFSNLPMGLPLKQVPIMTNQVLLAGMLMVLVVTVCLDWFTTHRK